MDTFNQKLAAGLQGEEIVAAYLQNVLGYKVEQSQGFNRDYDLLVNGKPVEVTTDIWFGASGRVCLEHRKLETHTAPTWIWLIPSFYWTKTEDLKKLYELLPEMPVGDDGRPGVMVKRNSPEFNEYFHPLKWT